MFLNYWDVWVLLFHVGLLIEMVDNTMDMSPNNGNTMPMPTPANGNSPNKMTSYWYGSQMMGEYNHFIDCDLSNFILKFLIPNKIRR